MATVNLHWMHHGNSGTQKHDIRAPLEKESSSVSSSWPENSLDRWRVLPGDNGALFTPLGWGAKSQQRLHDSSCLIKGSLGRKAGLWKALLSEPSCWLNEHCIRTTWMHKTCLQYVLVLSLLCNTRRYKTMGITRHSVQTDQRLPQYWLCLSPKGRKINTTSTLL